MAAGRARLHEGAAPTRNDEVIRMKRQMKQLGFMVSLVIIMGLLVASSETGLGAEDEDTEAVTDRSTVKLMADTPAVTRKDLEQDFMNYAEEESTVTFPTIPAGNAGEPGANVVGVVLEFETEAPVSNAEVAVDGQAVVVSGEDGRFQITNTPNGTYDWTVTAAGYKEGRYLNYSVDYLDGANIFTFYISRDEVF